MQLLDHEINSEKRIGVLYENKRMKLNFEGNQCEDYIEDLLDESEKNKIKSSNNFMLIEQFKENLAEKQNDIGCLKVELREGIELIKKQEIQIKELGVMLTDSRNSYKIEKLKSEECNKLIQQLNNKIVELENQLSKSTIVTLKSKIETPQNEVESKYMISGNCKS